MFKHFLFFMSHRFKQITRSLPDRKYSYILSLGILFLEILYILYMCAKIHSLYFTCTICPWRHTTTYLSTIEIFNRIQTRYLESITLTYQCDTNMATKHLSVMCRILSNAVIIRGERRIQGFPLGARRPNFQFPCFAF